MAKKKKSGGGGDGCGGGGGGQQPKPAEEKAVGDHADERTAGCDKEKGKDKDKGKKAPPPPPLVTAVLKVDMHCDGCAKRIRASVRHYPGVEGVAMDVDKGSMTVVGRFDAKKLRDRVATKTKKKVELVVGNNNQQNKGKDDEAAAACNKKQQHNDLKVVHEYGKPEDHMYWIDKVCNKAVQDKDKAKEDNKACGGGGGGKAKDGNKGSGGGEGNKDDKGPGGDKGKGGKKPVVPVVGTVVLKIGAMGLHCDGCMNRVRTKLFKIKGVEQVSMEMGKNQVTVTGTMDVKALPGKLQKKVRRPVDVVQAANKEKDKDKQDGNKQQEGCSKEGNNSKQDGGCSREKQDKDAATKALTAEMEMWKTAFYDQQSLLNTEFMLSDENPNACSVM